MLELILIKTTNDHLIYHYFPEAKSAYGILSINTATGEIQIIKVSESDMHRRYLSHAVSELRKFYETGIYCKESIVHGIKLKRAGIIDCYGQSFRL